MNIRISRNYYDPLTIIALSAVLTAGVGVASAAGAFGGNKNDSSGPPPIPTLPNQNKAEIDAKATQTRQRQILLASGGQTDYTGGTGSLLDTDTTKATLLGG